MKDYAKAAETESPERRVPIELNPQIFDERVGDTEADPVLYQARKAFSLAGEKLKDWHKREAAIYANRFESATKKKMIRSAMVKAELPKRGEVVGRAQREIDEALAGIDRNLDKAFRARLPREDGREIREYLRGMTKAKRREFLAEADDETLAAALASKPFLSGLGPAEASRMRQEAIQRWYPEELQRAEKLQTAKALLDDAVQVYMREAQELIDPEVEEFEAMTDRALKAASGQLE